MKSRLFKNVGGNQFKINENAEENPVFIDRHGSLPNRPKSVQFNTPDEYNDHMGFDASLPDDLMVTPEQKKTVKELMKQGYKITGHAKMTDNSKQIEILMTLHTKTGSRYADVQPSGKRL
jgi:hypothetical protein